MSRYQLFGTSEVPADFSASGPPVLTGTAFFVTQTCRAVAIRFYKGSVDTSNVHTVVLWDAATGVNLGEADSSSEPASGWVEVSLPAPVTLTLNHPYYATWFSPNGFYVYTDDYFASAKVSGPITGYQEGMVPVPAPVPNTGVYDFNSVPTFPNAGYPANYWGDVVVVTALYNMVGPTGVQGDTGAKGSTGTGSKGLPGAAGAAGSAPTTQLSSDSGNIAVLGSDSLLWVPASSAPIASPTQAGLLQKTSGLVTDFVNGANVFGDLPTAIQPTIRSVRNRSINTLINPSFEIDQRNIGAQVNTPASGTYLADGWALNFVGTTMSFICQQQVQAVFAPGTSYQIGNAQLSVMVGQLQSTLRATDYLIWGQGVEGIMARPLFWGNTSLSLLVYSSIAPVNFSVAIRSPDATRSIVYLCTVPVANVPTYITIPNIPAFNGGNFTAIQGTRGYTLNISLAVGSTYIAPAAGSWQNGNFFGAPGMDNWARNPSGTQFCLLYVQHEPGPICTQFIELPFEDNIRRCQRYFYKSMPYNQKVPVSGPWTMIGQFIPNSSAVRCMHLFPYEMCKIPTIQGYDNTANANSVYIVGISGAPVATASWVASARGLQYITLSATNSYGGAYQVLGQFLASAYP